MDENKRKNNNEKQRIKYQNNQDFRKRKQELARFTIKIKNMDRKTGISKIYYQNKKYGNFEIGFSNETKKIYFE